MEVVVERRLREGMYVYMELIHAVLQQKLTQYCKAIALQLHRIIFLNNWGGKKKKNLDTH